MVIERGHSRFHIDHHGHDGAIVSGEYKDSDRSSAMSRRVSRRIEAVGVGARRGKGQGKQKKRELFHVKQSPLESGENET